MRVWIHPEDLLQIDFPLPLYLSDRNTLVGFHLSISMGYMDSAQYFCCISKTVADLANMIWEAPTNTAHHSLSALAETPTDPEGNVHAGIISSKLDASITTRLPSISTVALPQYVDAYVA